jgi:hypothetical protein
MINDPSRIAQRRIPSADGRVRLVERRAGLIPDHVVDTAARARAVALRLGQEAVHQGGTYAVARDVSRVRA